MAGACQCYCCSTALCIRSTAKSGEASVEYQKQFRYPFAIWSHRGYRLSVEGLCLASLKCFSALIFFLLALNVFLWDMAIPTVWGKQEVPQTCGESSWLTIQKRKIFFTYSLICKRERIFLRTPKPLLSLWLILGEQTAAKWTFQSGWISNNCGLPGLENSTITTYLVMTKWVSIFIIRYLINVNTKGM